MLIRTFKIRSRIVYGGRLGRLQRSYYLTYKDTEADKVVDNTFPADSEFIYTVTYSNDNVEGKTITFTTIDSLNGELGNTDPNYESYSVFVDVLEKSIDTPKNSEVTGTVDDNSSTSNTEDDSDTGDDETSTESTQETSDTDNDTNHSDTSSSETESPKTNQPDGTDGEDESKGEPESETPVILPDGDGYIVGEVPIYPEAPTYPELR